jgi:hypothetical protein
VVVAAAIDRWRKDRGCLDGVYDYDYDDGEDDEIEEEQVKKREEEGYNGWISVSSSSSLSCEK